MIRTAVFLLVLAAAIQIEARRYFESGEYQEWEEFKEFQRWKRNKHEHKENRGEYHGGHGHRRYGHHVQTGNINSQDPPPIDEAALMGRYIVNQADWTSVATISSQKGINSFPFVNIISFSDGPLGNGSGVPYLFLTPLDFTAQDVAKDNRATLMVTLAQGDYCKQKVYDPMDPRCARVVLTGKIKTVKNTSPEYEVAKNAVYNRHPWLAHMPPDHHFYFAKLKIAEIAVLDTFGGPKYVTVQDYFHPPSPNVTATFLRLFPINRIDSSSSEEEDNASYEAEAAGSYEDERHDPSVNFV